MQTRLQIQTQPIQSFKATGKLSFFRDCTQQAVDVAACVLGIEVTYIDCDDNIVTYEEDGEAKSVFFVTAHSTHFDLNQQLEMTETSVIVSISKTYVPEPRVGDTFVNHETLHVFEIDGMILDTPSKTEVSVRYSGEWTQQRQL